MGRPEKERGRRTELQCRDLVRQVWPGAYRVGQQMPVREPDVARTPYWIEIKSALTRGGLRPFQAWDQALADIAATKDPRPPLVYLQPGREPALVLLRATDWIRIEAERILGRVIG